MDHKPDLVVAIDECVESLDAVTTRAIFCCSELNSTNQDRIERQLEALRDSTPHDGKFHMSNIKNHSLQEKIAEFICTLPFVATLLVFHSSTLDSRQVKIRALEAIIREENRLALTKGKLIDYHIEYSNEYEEIISRKSLRSSSDDILTFLPDVVCYAYRLAIKNGGTHPMYNRYVRDKIRLEVRMTESHITRLQRQDKL